jgi:hypothetical protein
MNTGKSSNILFFLFCVCALLVATSNPALPYERGSGPVSGIVERADDPNGLSVREAPAADSRVIGYVEVGARVRGFPVFRNGWAQLRHPIVGGWARMDNIRPVAATATVVETDPRESCLHIRSGPSPTHESVGCVKPGEEMELTGIWTEANWAEVERPVKGWVYGEGIRSDIKPEPPPKAYARPEEAPERVVPFQSPPYPQPPRFNPFPQGDRRTRGRYVFPSVPPGWGFSVETPPVGVSVHPETGVNVRAPFIGVHVGPAGLRLRFGP